MNITPQSRLGIDKIMLRSLIVGYIPDYLQGILKLFWVLNGRTRKAQQCRKGV